MYMARLIAILIYRHILNTNYFYPITDIYLLTRRKLIIITSILNI